MEVMGDIIQLYSQFILNWHETSAVCVNQNKLVPFKVTVYNTEFPPLVYKVSVSVLSVLNYSGGTLTHKDKIKKKKGFEVHIGIWLLFYDRFEKLGNYPPTFYVVKNVT